MGKIQAVVGGLYGSEGKGAIAGHLASTDELDDGAAVRVGGSQAGHTVLGKCPEGGCGLCTLWGHPWPLRHVPVAAVVNPLAQLVIAAGSEVDISVLRSEVEALAAAGIEVASRMFIDPMATVIGAGHLLQEAANGIVARSGSTGKGVGAARADRIMRTAPLVRDAPHLFKDLGEVAPTFPILRDILRADGVVQIEGTQGYGLGLHTEAYPHVTSTDCRAVDVLAQAGLSPWAPYVEEFEVFVVVRPYPIRIAGNSGPMRNETTWDKLGLPSELTTVTRKTRRVGEWDPALARAAVEANGGPSEMVWVALAMGDHADPAIKGGTDSDQLTDKANDFILRVESDTDSAVGLVGTGPGTVIDLR